jgi:hypothetical protein
MQKETERMTYRCAEIQVKFCNSFLVGLPLQSSCGAPVEQATCRFVGGTKM